MQWWRDPRWRIVAPWGVSVTLHLVLVIAAAFIVWRVRDTRGEAPPMVVSFEEPTIAPAMTLPSAPPSEPQIDDALEQILTPPSDALPMEAPALPSLSEPPPIVTPPVDALDSPETQLAQPLRVEFSGLGASDARDIVYVVDASGSMITSLPDVLNELRRSISRLHPTQRFQVLLIQSPREPGSKAPAFLYRNVTGTLKKPVLIDATRAHKEMIFDWLSQVSAQRASNVLPALQAAVALRPDAIFLLSSGVTDPALLGMSPEAVLERLDQLNPKGRDGQRSIVIQTIQVLEDDPARLLRRIAHAHGGESGYKFISRDDLARQFSQDGGQP